MISDNASGVDFEAHYHAFLAGGSTILVLPEGISHFHIEQALVPVWNWERVLVVSQFYLHASWKPCYAMIQNQVIISLSQAVIVIEAREKGGTMDAGLEVLRHKQTLYVVEYQDTTVNGRGNEKLLKFGGKRLPKSRSSRRANMQKSYANIEAKSSAVSTLGQKESLSDSDLGQGSKESSSGA